MRTELLPMMLFVLISTFSPGPSNLAGATMGLLYGYRQTLKFLLGMASGFFLLMLLSAWAAGSLLTIFPALSSILRYVGAVYILSLALGMVKASYTVDSDQHRATAKPWGFTRGLLLQLLNPKLIVYGLTLFSTFFASLSSQLDRLLVVVTLLALTAFCATSVWTLFGTLIKTYLRQPRMILLVNALLALLLVYSALELAGVGAWLLG
jgi:cysteine/O-acetylserine efflux protein